MVWANQSQRRKRHLDWFSRFCMVTAVIDRQTHRSWNIGNNGRIFAPRTCDAAHYNIQHTENRMQSNPLKWTALLGPDYAYPRRQSIHLCVLYVADNEFYEGEWREYSAVLCLEQTSQCIGTVSVYRMLTTFLQWHQSLAHKAKI